MEINYHCKSHQTEKHFQKKFCEYIIDHAKKKSWMTSNVMKDWLGCAWKNFMSMSPIKLRVG